jgi:hypothetical protein
MTTNTKQAAIRELRQLEQDDPLLHDLAMFLLHGREKNDALFDEIYQFLDRYFADELFRRRVDAEIERDDRALVDPVLRARLMGAARE